MKMGKRFKTAGEIVEAGKAYSMEDGLKLLPEIPGAKFDETVEVSGRLGVNPKHPEQMVRGSVVLPNGTGRKVRVLVFAKGEKESEAAEAGADFIGSDEFIEKIKKGWLGFDAAVALQWIY